MVILTLTEKGGEPRQLTFEKEEVTIGRVQGNDVVLPKGNVSKRHCRIYAQDGGFSVEDMKSTNGTYINGRKISEPTVVSTADKIYVGDFVIRVDNATPAEVPTPAPPANEAGSLGSALPRRPPPPPPSARPTGAMRALDAEEAPPRPRSSGRITLPPPPPPPPPKRDTGRPVPVLDEEDLPPPEPSAAPSDIDLDEEPSVPQPPKLNVPPLRPVMSLSDDEDERRAPDADEIPTATRDRSAVPLTPASTTPVPGDYPGWLRRFLDEGASAVFIAGPHAVELERGGRREPGPLPGEEANALLESLRSLAARGTPAPARDAGVVNVVLPDGSRLVAMFPPVASQVCAAIYRPVGPGKGLGELVTEGAMSREMQQVLEASSSTRRNVLVCGERRAGEQILQALANSIASRFRVILAADCIVAPAGNPGWTKLTGDLRGADVIGAMVALRPDYLIVDVSGPDLAARLTRELALGQEGTFALLPGRSATDALNRLHFAAGGNASPVGRELLATSFDLVVHAAMAPDGGVRVTEVAEPRVESDGRLAAEPLLSWRPEEGRGGGGKFQVTGAPSRLGVTLASRGVAVPANVLRR